MKVRLTRKLAARIDGIDLTGKEVGEVIDLPARDAKMLVAEGWAMHERMDSPQILGRRESRIVARTPTDAP